MATATGRRVRRLRWTTHQITGVGLAAVAAAATDASTATAVVLLAGAWLGSLLPDADKTGTKIYRRTRVERRSLLARGVGTLARVPLRVLVLLPHRGITHSLCAAVLAAVLAGGLVTLVSPPHARIAAAGVALGYLAHVAADACTPGGVTLFAPFSRRRRHLLPKPARIRTGSLREYAAAAALTVTLVVTTVLLSG
jgi:inner membrane protein